MVSIEIDGVYCSTCKKLHPKLYWHEKFNDYVMPYVDNRMKTTVARFGLELSDEWWMRIYKEKSLAIGIRMLERAEPCSVCATHTNFVEVDSESFVCSEECLNDIRRVVL